MVTGSPASAWQPNTSPATREAAAVWRGHQSIGRPQHPRQQRDTPRHVREVAGGNDRAGYREDDRADRGSRPGESGPEQPVGSPGRQRKRQRDPEVERHPLAPRQPQQHHRQQEHLVQRVGHRGLAGADVGIPERPFAAEQTAPEPQVALPEEERQIADVEDAMKREEPGEWNQRDGRGEPSPAESIEQAAVDRTATPVVVANRWIRNSRGCSPPRKRPRRLSH